MEAVNKIEKKKRKVFKVFRLMAADVSSMVDLKPSRRLTSAGSGGQRTASPDNVALGQLSSVHHPLAEQFVKIAGNT